MQSALKAAERASQKSEVLSTDDSTLIEASAIVFLSFRSTSLPARSASCASAHPSQHLNTPRNAQPAIAKEQRYRAAALSRLSAQEADASRIAAEARTTRLQEENDILSAQINRLR